MLNLFLLVKKPCLTLRYPLIVSGVRAAIAGFPLILCALPLSSAQAEMTLETSTGPIYLSERWPETSFVVAENAIISTVTDSTLYGNNWADWNVVVNGSVIDNTYSMAAAGAIHLDSATAGGSSLENYGNISATLLNNGIAGVKLDNGGSVINHAGAVISSAGGYGIFSSKSAVNITNDGSISGSSSGMRLVAGGIINQGASGVISSYSGIGLINDGGNIIINNAGTIKGANGIMMRGTSGGSITNSGTISGNTGILVQGSNATVLRNSGTITGTGGTAVSFSSANNQLILQTGSVLNGNATSTGSNNTLVLEGNGAEDHNFSGFTTLSAIDNGLWTLGGNITTTAASSSATRVENGKLIVTGQLNNSGVNAGTTISNGGIVEVGNGGTVGDITGNVNVESESQLAFNRSDTVVLSSDITGAGMLTQNGTGTLVLANTNTNTGGITINRGTLMLSNRGTLGSGNIINNGALLFNHQAPVMIIDIISGSGSLTQAANGNITLTGDNTYTGETIINAGSLQIGNGGSTGSIVSNVINNATLDFRRSDITRYNGIISGSGQLIQSGSGSIILTGDNTFSGITRIDNGALQLGDGGNSGSLTGDINNNGVLIFNRADTLNYEGNITGTGSLAQQGAGTLILNGNSDYTGSTAINSGTLIVGEAATSGAQLTGTGPVTVASGATLSGNGSIACAVNNLGTIAALNTLAGHENDAIGHFTVGDLTNNGTVNLAGGALGNTLTVNGNYVGNNGLLILNTSLGDDNAASDKLIVQGDTSGDTRMQVINMHGIGQQTNNGIEVVNVRGNSNGSFALQGRAVAGAYEYFLHQGIAGDGNWYLRSALPTEPVTPTNPVTPTDPETKPTLPVSPVSNQPTIKRPEAGAYTANLAAANTMFVTTLHDRLGETNYVDALSGETKVTSMWLRQVGGRNSFHDSSDQLKTTSNRYVVQLGGDFAQWSNNGLDRWHLGAMAGYGNSQNDTDSRISSYSTRGSVDGYNLGLYATWFANEADKTGAYLDSWAQYGWFNNEVNGEQLHLESYHSSGLTASVESGYTFKMGESSGISYFIQPQAQAIWMGVKADDHTEVNGTKVTSDGDGNFMTRLGVRTYMNGYSDQDKGKNRQFQPFVEVNWIHNTQDFSTAMDNVTTVQNGAKNIGEVKTGVEGQINPSLNLWGHVGTQIGNAGYNDSSITFGIKYNF